MSSNQWSPLSDSVGCLTGLYHLIATIVGFAVYGTVGLELIVQGDLCGLAAWFLFLGPIVGAFAGAVWPLLLLGWLAA